MRWGLGPAAAQHEQSAPVSVGGPGCRRQSHAAQPHAPGAQVRRSRGGAARSTRPRGSAWAAARPCPARPGPRLCVLPALCAGWRSGGAAPRCSARDCAAQGAAGRARAGGGSSSSTGRRAAGPGEVRRGGRAEARSRPRPLCAAGRRLPPLHRAIAGCWSTLGVCKHICELSNCCSVVAVCVCYTMWLICGVISTYPGQCCCHEL